MIDVSKKTISQKVSLIYLRNEQINDSILQMVNRIILEEFIKYLIVYCKRYVLFA